MLTLITSSNRAGMRGLEALKQTGKVMVQGGGTFGVFMSVSNQPFYRSSPKPVTTELRPILFLSPGRNGIEMLNKLTLLYIRSSPINRVARR